MPIVTDNSVEFGQATRKDATIVAGGSFHPVGESDRGIELVRPIPFGSGLASGTRFRLNYPGAQYDPFLTLSLIEPEGPSFIVVEPGRLFDDYLIAIPEMDADLLELADSSDVLTFVIVSTQNTPATVNLAAPIVINRRTKRGLQVILEDSDYDFAVSVEAGTSRP